MRLNIKYQIKEDKNKKFKFNILLFYVISIYIMK